MTATHELGGPFGARPTAALHPALAALGRVGLLPAPAAGRTGIRNLSRAHPVWGVDTPDGRHLVVKSLAQQRGADLGIEFLVYRLAEWCEPIREALPRWLVVDEERSTLVLWDEAAGAGSLAERAGWPALLGPNPAPSSAHLDLPTVAEAVGRTLGAVHRGTAGLPLPPARPPLILAGLTGGDPGTDVLRSAVAELQRNPWLVAAARELAGPVNGCLVNHDLKWDNVVLTPQGRPVLVDWELAGLGDPAWDLGCLLAEHLVRSPRAELDEAARRLLAGYRHGALPKPEVAATLARRTVLAASLRIVQLGLEFGQSGNLDGPYRTLIAHAGRIETGFETLTREVEACQH